MEGEEGRESSVWAVRARSAGWGSLGVERVGGVFRREGEPPPVGRLPPDWPRVTQPAILIGPRNRTHPAMAALSVCTRQLRSFPGNPPASPFPPPPLRLVQHALAFLPLWSSPTRPPRPRSLRQVHPPRTGARRGTRLSLSLHGVVVIVESRTPPPVLLLAPLDSPTAPQAVGSPDYIKIL